MTMKTVSILLGLASLASSACAVESGDGDESPAAVSSLLPGGNDASIPAVARAFETARAIDRSVALSRFGDSPAGAIAAPGDLITVRGRVLQLSSGASVSHLPVVILGQDAAVKTDEDGNFLLPNVTAPYDVAVGTRSGDVPNWVVYEGLLRTDPRLVAIVEPELTATITGLVSGGAGFPQPPGHFAFVQIGSDGGGMGFSQVFFNQYAASAQWSFTDTTVAHLTAIQFAVEAGRVKTFTGASTAQFPITAGRVVDAPVHLRPVKTATMSGTYTYPPGYSFLGVIPAIESVNFSLLPLPIVTADTGTFSLANPVIRGRSTFVVVEAFSSRGGLTEVALRGFPHDATDLAIHLPEAPDIIAPPDHTVDVDHDTVFQTSEFAAGVYLFQFSASTTDPTFTVVSSDPVARIPDLSALGAPLPPSHHYFLQMTGMGPFTDVDDFAGPTGPRPSPELVIVASPFIRFVTAP